MNFKLEKFEKFSFNGKLAIGTIFHIVNKYQNRNKKENH